MPKRTTTPAAPRKTIHCAIYTRKSTEEGLEQAFNSLDAQRESGEACIAAQKHEGWICLPDRYDDGGFSGGNIERPALRRLLADIEAGKVDCVVVYKVDRLSRSLLDFSRVMQVFERHGVSFVSVTQQFNTTHSMGRLTLNILLSFAQFEREIISERTRDKIAAARKKGKWSGGKPLLGYDVVSAPSGSRLVITEDEAHRVRAIFELYLQHQALIPVVTELARRGWTNKRWVTKTGREIGGRAFDKSTLHHFLTNRTYTGVVEYQGQSYPGEHEAIVDAATFERVNAVLKRNGHTAGAMVRNRYGALLKGLLRCSCCDCGMIHTYTSKAGKRYRYYVCLSAQKKGWHTCPAKSVAAGEIEAFVVQQIKRVGADQAVLEGTLRKLRQQQDKAVADLKAEQRATERELARHDLALRKLAAAPNADCLAEVNEQVQSTERRLHELKARGVALEQEHVDPDAVRVALSSFTPVWEQLAPREQARVIALLVERVEYDGQGGTVSVTFRPAGIKALSAEQLHEVAA